jgi:hypothetical protein
VTFIISFCSLSIRPTMPTESSYPAVDIPNVDLWGLMFEQKRKESFPDDQGIQTPSLDHYRTCHL